MNSPSGLSENEKMALRDWFAGQALAGMMANERLSIISIEEKALSAYKAADAMMKQREKPL